MSANEQARALMMRHYHQIKNRQQSMLQRAGSEIGMPGEVSNKYWHTIQGKISPDARMTCDRSNATMS
jgi:predicted solute-binding protein